MKSRRTHPYTIIETMSKFLFVLILPLVQQILYLYTDFFTMASTVTIDLSILFLILSYCFFKYNTKKYICCSKYISIEEGVLSKSYIEILTKNIASLTLKYKVFPSLFGSNKLIINTLHSRKKSKIELNLSRKKLLNIIDILIPKRKAKYVYKAPLNKIILMAASWSNPVKGIIIIAPFINKLGKILGQEISDKLYHTVDIGVNIIAKIVPPVFAGLTYILLICFLIAMLFIIFQYSNLRVIRTDDSIIISKGLINSSQKILAIDSINTISIRQTILMKILRLYSAYINVASSDKDEQNLLIAPSTLKILYYNLRKLIKADVRVRADRNSRPPKKAIKGFVLPPLLSIIAAIIIYLLLPKGQLLTLLTIFLELIFISWFIIRVEGYRNTYACIQDDKIFISGYTRLTLYSNIIPKEKIQYIKVSRNPLQRFSGLATIRIYIKSDKKEVYKAKQLKLEYVGNFVENIENS